MRPPLLLFLLASLYTANIFVLKNGLLHVLATVCYAGFPAWLFTRPAAAAIKGATFITWALFLIPAGGVLLMTLVFGFPPEGYTLRDIFGVK